MRKSRFFTKLSKNFNNTVPSKDPMLSIQMYKQPDGHISVDQNLFNGQAHPIQVRSAGQVNQIANTQGINREYEKSSIQTRARVV